jgi:hypothetical protein
MSRAAAYDFLCACLSDDRSHDSREALLRTTQNPAFLWETFVEIANETLVAPAVFPALQRKNIAEAIPQDVLDFFDGMTTLNRQRNELLFREATELAVILNKVDVIPVFLKGAAHLLSDLYPDPAERIMVDIDVLVPTDRLSDCATRLYSEGYHALTKGDYTGHHHLPPLGRPGTTAAIEIHSGPIDLPYRQLMSSSDVFDGAIVLHRGAAQLAVPSGLCRMIHVMAHAQLANHGYIYGHLALRDLSDFARLHRAFAHEIDWKELGYRFAACGATIALEFHLLAAARLLGVPIDPAVKVSKTTQVLFRRALWQESRPNWSRLSMRLLRPYLLLRRSLSDAVLRRRLVRSLTDRTWYRRQWRMLRK